VNVNVAILLLVPVTGSSYQTIGYEFTIDAGKELLRFTFPVDNSNVVDDGVPLSYIL